MQDGYPEEEDIAWLKKELATNDFIKGAQALTTLLFGTGYARCTWLGEPGNVTGLEVATGGWSGCEEILMETHLTLWRALYWDSTHRGGMQRFLRTSGRRTTVSTGLRQSNQC